MQRLWLGGVLAAVVLGAVLRLACLSAEFWLDEIWSWELARGSRSVVDLFVHQRHDNNHHLNTLWLFLCPEGASPALYRLHSLVAGLTSIVLAAKTARRWGKADAVFAAFLTASAYWLVLASTEARGYALAACFALLALDALWEHLESRSRRALVLFWLGSVCGFLSHLTFVHAYLGFVVWSLHRQGKTRRSAKEEILGAVRLHGPPGVFFVLFYLLCIRGMEVGGGPPTPASAVLARLIGLGLGGPAGGWPVLPWLIVAGLLFVLGLRLLIREGNDVWVFFLVAVAGSPALFLLRRPPFLFERYFMIPFVFFLLLSAHLLGALWRAGAATRGRRGVERCLLALLVLTAVTAGNITHVRAYAAAGRGAFRQALAWVVENDSAPRISVSGDLDFRVRKYVQFYARSLEEGRKIEYRSGDDLPPGGAQWLFVHRLDDQHPPGEVEQDVAGNRYRLVREYPSRGPACWGWFVYQREK